MDSFAEMFSGWLMWPLIKLWQIFDQFMQRAFIAVVSVSVMLLIVMAWAHFYPAPKPTLMKLTTPAVTVPASPFSDSRYPGAMTLEAPADRR